MKAAFQRRYGAPSELEIADIDTPVAGDNEVLLRVRAAALNPLDWHNMRGLPYPLRIGSGFAAPKPRVLGVDVAGRVESIGQKISEWKPGDEVFGVCNGSLAEYACARADRLARKPERLSFEQAAAIPVGALTALQALRNRGRIAAGQKVLIVGASGGVGTFAVQIAKSFGAIVTGVCRTRNLELVRSIGADEVIDYTRESFTQMSGHFDLIVDMVGTHALLECRRALRRRGTYVIVGAPSGDWFRGPDRFLKALLLSPFVGQRFVPMISAANQNDFVLIKSLVDDGKVTPTIDRTYELTDAAAALHYLEEGHARGKVVITTTSSTRRTG